MQISTGFPLVSIAHSRSAKLSGEAPNKKEIEMPITTIDLFMCLINPQFRILDLVTVQVTLVPGQYSNQFHSEVQAKTRRAPANAEALLRNSY